MSYINRIFQGAVITVGAGFATSVVGYVLKLFLARSFSVAEYGFIFAFLSFFNLFTILYNFGIERALLRFLPEFQVKGKHKRMLGMFFWSLLLQLGIAVVIATLLYLSRGLIAVHFFKREIPDVFFIIGVIYFILSPVTLVSAFLRGIQRVKAYAFFHLLSNIALIAVSAFLFNIIESDVRVMLLMLAYIVWYLMVFFVILLKLLLRDFSFLAINSSAVKQAVTFGLPIFIVTIFNFIFSRMDVLFITYFNGLEEVGYYNVADSTANAVLSLILSFGTVYLPLVSEMWTKEEYDELEATIPKIIKYISIVSLPAFLFLIFNSQGVIGLLFGEKYLPGYLVLSIYAPILLFNPLRSILSPILLATDQTKYIAKISLFAFSVDMLGNVLLIPRWGGEGATISSVAGSFILLYLVYVKVVKTVSVKFPFKEILKVVLSTSIFVFSFWIFDSVVSFGYLSLIISLTASGIIYLGTIVLFRVVTYREIMEIVERKV